VRARDAPDVGLWQFMIDVLVWQYKHKQSCIVRMSEATWAPLAVTDRK